MQEEKDYESEQNVEIDEMGVGSSDTGESITPGDEKEILSSDEVVT